MAGYQDVAYSLYCDRVRNRTPYCNFQIGCTCGGKYGNTRAHKFFLYPDTYCPSVVAAVDGLEATYPAMKAAYEEGDTNE